MKHDIEAISAAVHDSWMKNKRAGGVKSRKSEDGEELMAPYRQLSEKQKDQDRQTVKTVLDSIQKVHGDSMKKPGMEIAIGVGRPKPLKGAPGMMDDAPEMPNTPDPADDDSEMKAWCDRTDKLLNKIAEAVGVDMTEGETPEGGDSAEMPPEKSGYDS